MTEELPPGWAKTDIGTLGRYINGRGFGKAEWKKLGLPIVRIQNLNDESADFNYSDAEHEAKYRVKDGDLLVAWAASLGVYIWTRGPAWLNQHIFRVEIEDRAVTKPFLYYSLKHALEALYKKTHGSGMVHVTKGRFDSHPINLPPLNEQTRIVSKIDELFSRIEEGKRALERVQKLVERYRQSVLKAAVTGELTRDWRDKNKGQLESGEALLARILKARREAWEKAELDKMKAKGIAPANDKWKQRYEEPIAPDTTDLPELPKGWAWATPVQLEAAQPNALTIGPFGSNLKVSDYTGSGVPLIFVRNIRSKQFEGDFIKYVSPAKASELSSHLARSGDILITKMGEPPGDACVYPAGLADAVITADCIKWTLHPLIASASYVAEFINSSVGRAQIAKITKGVAQQKVSLDRFRQIAVALPGADEQREIAERLDIEVQRLQAAGASIQIEAKRAGAARQSVLRAAFLGELVSQDPADEPASLLLERIAAERGTAPFKPRRGAQAKTEQAA
jgi:type I restriction enzyme S subunit